MIWGLLACELAELASFFGQVNGLMFPLIEALGVGPVNVSAVEGGQGGFLGTCPRDTSFYWGCGTLITQRGWTGPRPRTGSACAWSP